MTAYSVVLARRDSRPVLFTLGGAAANMIPHHIPSAREMQRAEQTALIEARRARIAALLAEGDRCRVQIARELARALVFDGRPANDGRLRPSAYDRVCASPLSRGQRAS